MKVSDIECFFNETSILVYEVNKIIFIHKLWMKPHYFGHFVENTYLTLEPYILYYCALCSVWKAYELNYYWYIIFYIFAIKYITIQLLSAYKELAIGSISMVNGAHFASLWAQKHVWGHQGYISNSLLTSRVMFWCQFTHLHYAQLSYQISCKKIFNMS